MTKENKAGRVAIRYSEAFKIQVVRELESGGISREGIRRKYGIKGLSTVQGWVSIYGNGRIGKVIRVEKPEQVNQLKQSKERIRRLEAALADANIELALERQYTRIACQRAGIEDVVEFKKKAAGKLDTGR